MTTVHVYPVGDLIDHDTTGDGCVCRPTTEAVFDTDGSNGWVIGHHSLDGREHHEPGHHWHPGCPTTQPPDTPTAPAHPPPA